MRPPREVTQSELLQPLVIVDEWGRTRRFKAPVIRFRAMLQPVPSGCIEFQGSLNNKGYGQFGVHRTLIYAHRVAWVLENGEIPAGRYVCHTCDNPRCCNVQHLFLGTPIDNMQDKVRKGRSRNPTGENHFRCAYSDQDVRDMRAAYDGGESAYSIARRYGRLKTRGHVNRICQRLERKSA